ncbi:MAG: TonB-dependent receptor [Alteromonadaceae bacterium]|nr:TonB-dependent receptor [Alteromonadaceae bacterium]
MKIKYSYLSVLLALSPCALAEEESVERILVPSDFRNLAVDKLPASATIIDAKSIETRQARHLEDILAVAPNVNFNSGASRNRFVQIRGIGERSQFSEPTNPSVAFLVDDLDFSGTVGVGTLFDVEQVEVLKGPQGTAFGSSALAGAVKVKTRDSDGQQDGKVSLSIAQKGTMNLAAAYGDKISENLFFRAAVQQYESDGYIKNKYLNRDTNTKDELGARIKLRYLAADDITVDFSYNYFDIDNGYDAFSLDNLRETYSDEPGFDKQQSDALSIAVVKSFDGFDLKGTVSTTASDIDYGYDEDWTFVGFHPWAYQSTDSYARTRDTNAVDVRLFSTDAIDLGGIKTDWVVGIYAKNTDEDLLRQWTFGSGNFTSVYSIESTAVYGELVPQLTDKLTLTIGLRAEDSSLDYRDSDGFSDKTDETMIGGRLVADYQLDEDTLLYAGVNRGFKLGGFNPDSRISGEKRVYDAEFNWNYEAGVKQYLADGDIFVGLSMFYMDRENTQVSDFAVVSIDDSMGSSFIDIIDNADNGKNAGIELEARYFLGESSALNINLGLLDASFSGYTDASGNEISKRDQAQSPAYSFNVSLDIGLSEHWDMTIEADGKDKHFYSDGHNERSKEYVIYHATVNRSWDQWTVSLWGKNLFNTEYYTRGFAGFPNDPRDEYTTFGPYLQIADGRKMGATVEYQF